MVAKERQDKVLGGVFAPGTALDLIISDCWMAIDKTLTDKNLY